MKKFLLLFAVALMGLTSASAATDGQTYETKNGLKCANQWIMDRVHTRADFEASALTNTKTRTATVLNGVIYASHSEAKAIITGTDTIVQGTLHRYDVLTGKYLGDLDLTLDGKPYGGALLSCNQIGTDNFGHLWIMPYTSEKTADIPIYLVDTTTGALTLEGTVSKGDAILRVDFYDLVGDVTRADAECTIMAASTGDAFLYRWHAPKGGTFSGAFGSDPSYKVVQFYPQEVNQWSYGPIVKISLGADDDTRYAGDFFYVDGFQTPPALYDNTGSLIDSFESVDKDLVPEAGANGVAEFNLDGRDFMVYTKAQYLGDGHGCQTNVCEFGEDMAFAGMTKYWQLPADSLGKTSDTGVRSQSYSIWKTTENGEEVINLFTFKCYNGMGLWKIGKNVTSPSGGDTKKGDIDGDGVVNVKDVTALVNQITTGKTTEAADIDGDGLVNVKDVTALVNIITTSK